MTVVLPECAFVEPIATGHTHPDELHVGYRGGLWQQHFMILSHLLQMTAYLLNTLTRRQPFHLVVNMPLLLTIHGWMDEMAQLLVSFLTDADRGLLWLFSLLCLFLTLLGDIRPWHCKHAATDVAVEDLTVGACLEVVHHSLFFSFSFFFHLFFFVNLPVTLSLNTWALQPDSKWLWISVAFF